MKTMFLFLAIVLTAGLALAAHDYHGSHSQFADGYEDGYTHGQSDYHQRMGFDYSNGASRSEDWNDCEYRVGYLQGYGDGYFSIPRKTDMDEAAPRGGYHEDSHAGVVAYTDEGYHGKSAQFTVGDYPKLEGSFNDNIDSIQIQGNVRVILFDDQNFSGESRVVDHDNPDLGSFKNKAASMIVQHLPPPDRN